MTEEPKRIPGAVETLFKDAPENGKAMLKGALKGLPLDKLGMPFGEWWGALYTLGEAVVSLAHAHQLRRMEQGTGCYSYSDEQRNQGIFKVVQAGILAGVTGATTLIAAHLPPPESKLIQTLGDYIKEPLSTGLELHLHVCSKKMKEAAEHMKEAHRRGLAYCIEGAVGPACHYPRQDFGQPFFGSR